MSRKKQERISTKELKNLKKNLEAMKKNGTESQKKAIAEELSYAFGASHLSAATARFLARRLGVSFEMLCSEPKEEKGDDKTMQENIKSQILKSGDADVTMRLNAFLKRTGKTGEYVAKKTGLSKSSVSMVRRQVHAPRTEKALKKTLSVLPCSEEEIMSADPKGLILLFEEAAIKNNRTNVKKIAKVKKKSIEKLAETKKEKKENRMTNLEYYSDMVIETAGEFIRNGRQSASRATMNALRAVIPASADTPAKVLTWLMEDHEDRYVLNEAEEAMLDGYFRMHKNALTMLFSSTYMYSAKKESGMFANIPGDITLEYLRDHVVKEGEKNG